MKHISSVIPITPCNILFYFEDDFAKMKIKLHYRKYFIKFKSVDELLIWKSVRLVYNTNILDYN